MNHDIKSSWIDWAVYSVGSPKATTGRHNQDNYLTIDQTGQCQCLIKEKEHIWKASNWLAGHYRFVIMDGVGKNPLSREITEYVCKSLGQAAPFTQAKDLSNYLDQLHCSISHELVNNFGNDHGAGSTITVLEIMPNREAFIYHVGDSRLYALTNTGLELLTIDHCDETSFALTKNSTKGEWIDKVLFTPHNRITQAFGFGRINMDGHHTYHLQNLQPHTLPSYLANIADRRTITLPENFCLILATDGLWCFNQPQNFLDSLTHELLTLPESLNAQSRIEHIQNLHERHSSPETYLDNTSVIVIQTQRFLLPLD